MGPRTFATACGAIAQRGPHAAARTLGPGSWGLGTAEWGLRAGHCALLVLVWTHGHRPPHIRPRGGGHCAAGTPRCGPHTRAWVLGPGHCGVGAAGWALRTSGSRVDPRASTPAHSPPRGGTLRSGDPTLRPAHSGLGPGAWALRSGGCGLGTAHFWFSCGPTGIDPRTFAPAGGDIAQRGPPAAARTLGPGSWGLGTAEWGLRAGHCALLVLVWTHGHRPPHIRPRGGGHCAAGTPRCGPHTRAWVLGPGHCGVGAAGWA